MTRAKKIRIKQPVADDMAMKLWLEIQRVCNRDAPTGKEVLVGTELIMVDGEIKVYADIVGNSRTEVFLRIIELDRDEGIPF